MGQNDGVARSESSRRGRRTWTGPVGAQPERTVPVNAPEQHQPDPYQPRRRYPWHDDPDYDPAAHRRTPPPAPGRAPPPPPPPPGLSPTARPAVPPPPHPPRLPPAAPRPAAPSPANQRAHGRGPARH